MHENKLIVLIMKQMETEQLMEQESIKQEKRLPYKQQQIKTLNLKDGI